MTLTVLALGAPLVAALAQAPARPAPRVDRVDRVEARAARRPPARDRWIGADKAKHFLLAGLVQSVGFAAATRAGAGRSAALAMAGSATAAVSIAKEVRDRRAGGRFSGRDLAWDAAGAAGWSVLLARTEPR